MAEKSRGTKFTKEQIEKAMQCKNADELLALAKAELYDMTRDEAEAYMAEIQDIELDEETLKKSPAASAITTALRIHAGVKVVLVSAPNRGFGRYVHGAVN